MTQLAARFLGQNQVRLHCRSVGIVAFSALDKNCVVVRVYFRKIVLLMAIETPAFESKASALGHSVALSALDVGNRRMLMEWSEAGGRVRAGKEAYLLGPSTP